VPVTVKTKRSVESSLGLPSRTTVYNVHHVHQPPGKFGDAPVIPLFDHTVYKSSPTSERDTDNAA
jgi:hypothetical protein